jgi:HEAT repeat protein
LLVEALHRDASPFVRASAALGLGMLGDRAAVAVLAAAAAQTRETSLAESATLALGLLGDTSTSEQLARRMFAPDARVRSAAELALGALGHPARVLFEAPLQEDHTDLVSLTSAARAALTPQAGVHLGRYLHELHAAAADALRQDDAAKLAVLAFLVSEAWWRPASAPIDVRELSIDLRVALLPELSTLRAHPSVAVRTALASTLAQTHARDADALLMDLAQDRQAEVRAAALRALARRPLPSLPNWTERLAGIALSEPAFWLRQRAVLVLARMSSAVATRTLGRVLSTDPYALVRESAAQSLAGRDAGLAGPALLHALRDPEPRVCAAAARALLAVGGDALQRARSDTRLAPGLQELLVR